MTIKAGTKLGRYEIRSRIGEGGMGEVYLADETRLHRKAALKVLPAALATNKNRMRRFEQEAQAAAALNHPNIAHIYEVGEEGGTHFIAMEFVEGATLRETIHREKTELRKLLRYLQQVAEGLAKAHASGIVHRDLKPDNVMITRDGYAKILDFGLAKLTEPVTPQPIAAQEEVPTVALGQPLSTPGMVIGTVGYMSPEQAQGLSVDHRSDIFSFGCLLFEAATRRKAFESESTIDTLHKIIHSPAPQVKELNPAAPADLTRIVRRCLAKDPDDRYQSIKEAAIELRDVRRELEGAQEFETTVPPSSVDSAVALTPGGAATVSGAPHSTASVSSAEYIFTGIKRHKVAAIIVLAAIVLGGVGLAVFLHARNTEVAIESIAVLPLQNQNGDPDSEYLSDGLTESIINSITQLSSLRVSPRSSVFRYKGKNTDPLKVGDELGVRAVLTGRLLQRGDSLMVSVELLDVRDNKQIWGEQYNRKVADALAVQQEISREISERLRTKLSGEEQRQLTRRDTSNPEAYAFYLKGRYYALKRTLPETQKAISYFQQAIAVDPSYALAYVGLADAHFSSLAANRPSNEFFPQARAAAQKAIEIDDTLAAAHAQLGLIIFWYDWDWGASENKIKRALELNPDGADTHLFYAHLLSNTGRHTEALAEAKRARELDPLNLRINALEGQFLVHAGRTDEALTRLHETLEMDSNYFLAHLYTASAYIEKGMYSEAIGEARRAIEISGAKSTYAMAFLGYALAKAGKEAEARAVLEGLLKSSADPYHIALVYNGLGEHGEALAWLERAYVQRSTGMVFLKVEPKWNNLRSDSRFQDLLRRVGFAP